MVGRHMSNARADSARGDGPGSEPGRDRRARGIGPAVSSLLLGVALLVAPAILSGCRTPGAAGRPGAGHAKAPSSGVAAVASRPSDAELDRRARAHAAFAAGVVRQMQNDAAGMLEFWTRAVESDPSNAELLLEVARRRMVRSEFPAAIDLLEKATRQPAPGVSGPVWTLLGLAYVQVGRTNDAIGAYRKGLDDEASKLGAYASMGRLLVESSRPDEAMAHLAEAEKQEPGNAIFQLDVADLYTLLAQRFPAVADRAKPRAAEALDRVAALNPEDAAVLLRLADRNNALGRGKEAEAALTKVRERGQGGAMAAARLAEMYLRAGRLDDAATQLELLRKETPANPLPPYYLGAIAAERRQFEKAAEWYEKALLLDPSHEGANLDLIVALLNTGRFTSAAEAAEKARLVLKPNFRLEFLRGLALGRAKRYDAAVEAFLAAEKVAAGDPKLLDHRFHFQIGSALEEAGKSADAESRMETALKLQPDFAPALNHLGYTWADRGKNLEQSLGMIRKAVDAEPDNPAYIDSLAWVLFRLGRPAEALPLMEKAVKILEKEPDSTVLDHYGDVLAALKRWDEAKAAWKKALEIDPAPEIRKKLESAPK